MEDELWLLKQKYHDLQEYRLEIRAVWNDAAAREINSRYLNSHEADAEQMQIALNKQHNTLQQVDEKLDMVSKQVRLAEKLSREIAQHIASADEVLQDVHKHFDLFVQYNGEALATIPSIYQLINNANRACGKE